MATIADIDPESVPHKGSVLTTEPQTNSSLSRSSLGEEVRLMDCDQTNPSAGNGDITPEDIYEVLVGATADETSISTLCDRSEDSYSGNDILYHLRTKFDLDTVSAVGNTLLEKYTLEMLPEQVETVVDFHL